jgi:arylsulfatase A-like enzyme
MKIIKKKKMDSQNKRRPNYLFLFTDDQRFNTIRSFGNHDIATPTLNTLADNGTVFDRTYIMGGSCPAVCMPSRAMLNTGRSLFHIDSIGWEIPPEHITIGECLRGSGYITYCTGKWHNGISSFARSFTHGSEIFFPCGMKDHFHVPLHYFDPSGRYPDDGIHVHDGRHTTDIFTHEAVKFLKEYDKSDKEKPFFMYVSYMAPHDPRGTHPEFHAMYDPQKIPLPENYLPEHPFDNGELRIRDEMLADFPRSPSEIQQHISDYYAMISHADRSMGLIIEELKKIGEYDNTIIIFTGDNGLAVGQHGLMGKQNLYEHSLRVPLFMAGPGIPRGEHTDAWVYLQDLFPTICELSDIPIPASCESSSLLPVLSDLNATNRDVLHYAYKNLQRAVRSHEYKLIEYVVEGHRRTQLFNVENDPLEMNDLYGKDGMMPIVSELREKLTMWRDQYDDPSDDFWENY